MRFSELVLQGVRNFKQMHRIPLGAGFSVFVGPSGAGKSSVVDALCHLLHPNPADPATEKFRSAGAEACRAALLIDDDKGRRFRLVQDLASGAISLAQFEATANNYVPVSSAAGEIVQFLSSQVRIPQKDILEGIYIFRAGSLPSGAGAPGRTAAGADRPAGQSSSQPSIPGALAQQATASKGHFPGFQGKDEGSQIITDDVDEMRSQLEILKRDLATAEEMDDMQFKLDGLMSDQFSVDDQLKGVWDAEEKVKELNGELKPFAKLAHLPDDFDRRARDYDSAQQRLDRDMSRLADDEEIWKRRATPSRSHTPLWKDRAFWIGLGMAVLALGAGIAGIKLEQDSLRWLALVDLLGFGIVAATVIRHIDRKQDVARAKSRLLTLGERREKVQRQFEVESTLVRKAMDEIDADTPYEILEMFAQYKSAKEKLAVVKADLQARKDDPGFHELTTRRAQLATEIEQFEQKLKDGEGLMMSKQEMGSRIDNLQERLAEIAPEDPPVAEESGPTGVLDSPFAQGPVLATAEAAAPAWEGPTLSADPFADVVRLARDLLFVTQEQLEPILLPRASQLAALFTDQAYAQLFFEPGGSIECVDSSSGGSVAAVALPVATQDLVLLALRFSVIENMSSRLAIPVLLDDPFGTLPSERLAVVGQVLAGLGKQTQVVMFSSKADWTRYATASFQL